MTRLMNNFLCNFLMSCTFGALVGCTGENLLYAPDAGTLAVVATADADGADGADLVQVPTSADGGDLAQVAPSPDMATRPDSSALLDMAPLADMTVRPDMTSSPDLVSTPDMTELRDMHNCIPSLANVAGGDFTIRFTTTTRDGAFSAVLFQRKMCNAFQDWWDILINSDGHQGRPAGGDGLLTIFLNQAGAGTDPALITTTIPVNDGVPHLVVVQRRGGTIRTTTDGKPSGQSAGDQKLGNLPPVDTKRHPCGLPSVDGTITDICLTIP